MMVSFSNSVPGPPSQQRVNGSSSALDAEQHTNEPNPRKRALEYDNVPNFSSSNVINVEQGINAINSRINNMLSTSNTANHATDISAHENININSIAMNIATVNTITSNTAASASNVNTVNSVSMLNSNFANGNFPADIHTSLNTGNTTETIPVDNPPNTGKPTPISPTADLGTTGPLPNLGDIPKSRSITPAPTSAARTAAPSRTIATTHTVPHPLSGNNTSQVTSSLTTNPLSVSNNSTPTVQGNNSTLIVTSGTTGNAVNSNNNNALIALPGQSTAVSPTKATVIHVDIPVGMK